MQIPGTATARADGKCTGEMRLGTCREGRDLLMPDMNPFDLALATKRVGQPIQAIAHNAINPLDASRDKYVRKLVGYGSCHYSSFR
jgi:hypothetical protein